MKEYCLNCVALLNWHKEDPYHFPLKGLLVTLESLKDFPPCKEKTCVPLLEVQKLIDERKVSLRSPGTH